MAEPFDLVIRGGTVVDVAGPGPEVRQADVGVRAGAIAAVGPDLDVTGARVLDAGRAAVLPGFVNAHTHECLDRGIFEDMPFMVWLEEHALPKDRAYEPRHMRAAAWLNQAELIRAGTTSFIDIFRFPGEAAAVAVASGLRATFSPQLIDDPEGPGETLASTEAFIDEWTGRHPRVRAWYGPHSLYSVLPATLTTIGERARRRGTGVHVHLGESVAETRILADRWGLTPAETLDRFVGLGPSVLCAHGIELSDSDIELLAGTGAAVAHCPTSNMKLGNGVARIGALAAAGVAVGLGTDSIMTNNNLDPFEEMRTAALLQKHHWHDPTVLPSREVLAMATIGSACALGLDAEVGRLDVGKRADLAVVDLDQPHAWPLFTADDGGSGNVIEQLVWSCSAADVRHTVVDGAVLMEDRRLTTIDLDEVRDLVQLEARDLLTKAGLIDTIGRHP